MRMKNSFRWFLCLAVAALLVACASNMNLPAPSPTTRLAYPVTKKLDHVDTLHGTAVPDPYRWLEDDHAPETEAWVQAENAVTFAYLAQIPARAKLKARMTQLWN